MVVLRRDGEVVAVAATTTTAGPSGVSIGMLCLGIAALVIASGLCAAFYVQLRKTRAFRAEMLLQEKRAKIGKPTLQHAPEDVIEASLDISQMTTEMRQHFAKRHLQAVQPPMPILKNSAVTWSLPQSSSGSSGTTTSGPLPTSSSEGTNASSAAKSSESAASVYHSAHASQAHGSTPPQRPQRLASQPDTPSFVREKQVTRVAVPSALLRGLGDLPQLPPPGSKAFGVNKEASPTTAFELQKEVEPMSQSAASSYFHSLTVSNLNQRDSATAQYNDMKAQDQSLLSAAKNVVAGPSPITVDYFSMTSHRNMTSTQATPAKMTKLTSGKHSASSSNSSSSPYKKPDMELPPLPTMVKKQDDISAHDSIFRPLSLGFFLKSSSKSSSLHAATMFGDMTDSIWADSTDKHVPLSSTPTREAQESQEQSMASSSSKNSTINTALLVESRRGSETSDTATSVNDAYDGASFTKEEMQRSHSTEGVQNVEEELSKAEVISSAQVKARDAVPASVFRDGTSFAPFMTPHHRAVFPDQLNESDERRSSGAITPDLSQIHSAPLPPTTIPNVVPSLATPKTGFASSFKAKLSLSRTKSNSTPSKASIPLSRQVAEPAKKSLEVNRTRADSVIAVSRSPIQDAPSYSTVVETWSVNTEGATPAVGLGLGLGFTDGSGTALDNSSTNVQSNRPLLHSPAFEKHIGNRASSKMSQYSDVTFTPTMAMKHAFHSPMHEENLGSPPVRQMGSAQYGVLSTLSPKFGQSPTMVGHDWMLNRQQQSQHAHKSSYASSACDTISSCMTGESVSIYDGAKAHDQRAKLLQTIQQGKKASFDQDFTEEKGFVSHSARVSVSAGDVTPRPSSISVNVGDETKQPKMSSFSKHPANLTLNLGRGGLLEGNVLHTAPLTPPLTPGEQSHILTTAATDEENKSSQEEQTAARMAKLRPLSLAINQQKMTSAYQHRSQYSTASSITAPSASSSNASLYTSPNRISTLVTSPSRPTFKTSAGYNKSGASGGGAPVGVLPTFGADASPSFLTSTPRIPAATLASPRSPRVTRSDLANTPSPRFKRASIYANNISYHSPLETFTSPLRLQG